MKKKKSGSDDDAQNDSAKSFVRRPSSLVVAYQNQFLEAKAELVSENGCK